MYTVDLHNHTKFSYDGSNTPEEIIENAINNGIDVIGITDHQFTIGDNLPVYYEYIQHCKIKYADKIKVLCGLEIGTRPAPPQALPKATKLFDYVLFESLDDTSAMDFYEFLEWRKQFSCKAGLAHTDIFVLGERYGLDIIKVMRDNNIFWELNTSGNYLYYYDFLTNSKKQQIIKESGISVSVGSDTHYIAEYRKKQIRRANELLQELNIPLP
ncbi:MAG: PHP domain-containing protein [Clostridia bacterium]|nr:PHP domain-containing protein [Clostridia bacterium]